MYCSSGMTKPLHGNFGELPNAKASKRMQKPTSQISGPSGAPSHDFLQKVWNPGEAIKFERPI
jgi:hypothetical protein